MSFLFQNELVFSVVFAVLIFGLTYMWADRIVAWLHARSLGNREYVIQRLEAMFVEVDRRKLTITLLLASFGLGSMAFIAFWPSVTAGILFGSVLTVVGWTVPRYLVDYLYEKRASKFVDQMVDGMTIMANGVSSGLSVPQSMERVVQNMGAPISQEFNLVLSQIRLGLSVEEALNGLGTRISKPDVQMFVTSVNILKETGGNLSETFATITETIRERQKIQKKIEALTAQGIMQGIIITSIPFVLIVVFLIADPGFIKPLFTTTLGLVLLFVMLGLQVIGGLVIRKVVTIKV